MAQEKAREILRRIVPWISDIKLSKQRQNHKGLRGRIAIIGGARDYAGAPYYAAISSMRLGADLAYVICSQGASSSIKNYSPDLIVTPILDCPNEEDFSSEIDCLMTRLHTLVVGPGLGREELLQSRARRLIEEARARSIPVVLDADSLLIVNKDPSIIKSYSKALLTPNRIELQRLLDNLYAPSRFDLRNISTDEIQKLVMRCSTDLDVTILAKGMVDIICDNSKNFQLLTDTSSGSDRRCGGQGDILSGLAGVYLHWINQANKTEASQAIEHPTAWAAYLAAITTRRCNELAFKELKQGALASDMIKQIQPALESLLAGEGSFSSLPGTVVGARYAGSMTQDEIKRYARQMILDEFGPARQLKLKKASALIVGAGGLGCPSAVYLGAAGIGKLGIVDDDLVEASNLHRQILHNMNKVGMLKTESIKEAVLAINPNVDVVTHSVKMSRLNAVDLVEKYDMVLDCTDNLLTRYMISDACVVAHKPLISGAALKMDGQLTVYNYDAESPCFRCLFPEPPPPNAVGSCSENGVMGVIPGVIGVQQALEAIKIGADMRPAYAGKMLIFDGQLGLYRHITIGRRKPNCEACGDRSTLTRDLIDYEQFCGSMACNKQSRPDDILKPQERISMEQYSEILANHIAHVLVDVRPNIHTEISRFAHAITIPVAKLLEDPDASYERIAADLKQRNAKEIYVVCRKGIASQRGARIIQDIFQRHTDCGQVVIKDVIGGMTTWAERIDPSFSCV